MINGQRQDMNYELLAFFNISAFKPYNIPTNLNKKTKAPLHSLFGGFQPKPYHNYKCGNAFTSPLTQKLSICFIATKKTCFFMIIHGSFILWR